MPLIAGIYKIIGYIGSSSGGVMMNYAKHIGIDAAERGGVEAFARHGANCALGGRSHALGYRRRINEG